MKRLYLMRHAKSDWSTEAASDHERPLSARGRQAASTIGRFLTALRQAPQSIVTSDAVRARSTVDHAVAAGGWTCPVAEERRLYSGSTQALLEVVRRAPDDVSRLLVVGHEPTWSSAASRFVGGGSLEMVTAAVARIDLPIESWQGAQFGNASLVWLVTPKMLRRFWADDDPG